MAEARLSGGVTFTCVRSRHWASCGPVLRFGSPLPSEKLGPASVTHSAPPSHGTHTFRPLRRPTPSRARVAAQGSIAGRKANICTASAQRLSMVRRGAGWLQYGLCAGFFFALLSFFPISFLFPCSSLLQCVAPNQLSNYIAFLLLLLAFTWFPFFFFSSTVALMFSGSMR